MILIEKKMVKRRKSNMKRKAASVVARHGLPLLKTGLNNLLQKTKAGRSITKRYPLINKLNPILLKRFDRKLTGRQKGGFLPWVIKDLIKKKRKRQRQVGGIGGMDFGAGTIYRVLKPQKRRKPRMSLAKYGLLAGKMLAHHVGDHTIKTIYNKVKQ